MRFKKYLREMAVAAFKLNKKLYVGYSVNANDIATIKKSCPKKGSFCFLK
jgi:hypothetical protein